ncbi:translation initiation factor IF-2 subunit gamma [Candidatus Woesearchaeota archaeon CG10_big_fil_rev_8_21_14_0_10_30_7]|nr:MAG: translation initiation factor IF-2 subunit gamma [Candidatus Woesearchaeota archaeon CG10_big_fil_rev_8_21_14_0_10_30_7]
MIGHVDHGKTTLVKALSGKWTDTHSEEMKRGITIRLGYADVTIYKCKKCKTPENYSLYDKCLKCKTKGELIKNISLVDAPGHESLMATMLCGANIMDGALVLISANEECPQPQTQEHLMALEITGIKYVIILQNKIDLVSEEQAKKNYEQIKKFLKGTAYENAPIIPISALHNINIDYLLQTMNELFKVPKRDDKKEPLMFVARSFDINKPGTEIKKIIGGVLGGVLKQGVLKKNDEIEIRPGYSVEEKNQKVWKPITTKIEKLMSGGGEIEEAHQGGTFAVLTKLDPSIVKSDQLVGAVVSHKTKLPEVRNELLLKVKLLERAVGVKDKLVIDPLKMKEALMMNVYSAATVGIITELKKDTVKCILKRPVCAEKGAKVTLSRMLGQRWRLIGYGEIV